MDDGSQAAAHCIAGGGQIALLRYQSRIQALEPGERGVALVRTGMPMDLQGGGIQGAMNLSYRLAVATTAVGIISSSPVRQR